MVRAGVLLIIAPLLVTTLVPDAVARRRKPSLGVFGTINGKAFKASNLGDPADPCVNGIYRPSDGILVFAALECRARRRRQGATRRNYKVLAMACANFDPAVDVSTPPFELSCGNSVYTETRTGRFGQPLSMTQWGATFPIRVQ